MIGRLWLLASALLWPCTLAAQDSWHGQPQPIHFEGLERTRQATILGLLPHPPPGVYSDAELTELERRLLNLGIFDHVEVQRDAQAVTVKVREKWTLIPMIDFSSASSWHDTYLALSATEYNFLGRAMILSAAVWHQARGWNGSLDLYEHNYHASRGSYGGTLEYASAEYAFEDSPDAWGLRRAGAAVYWTAPLRHGSYWNYQLNLTYRHEQTVEPETPVHPPNGHYLRTELTASWEDLRWTDLAPHGLHLRLILSPGAFLHGHGTQPRMEATALVYAAHSFGSSGGLVLKLSGVIENRGNPNFSRLLGSYDGVRGLADGIYHNWLQAVLNLELREAWRFAERWALQGVLFSDLAAFDRIDARGERRGAAWAASVGAGVRLVPTFLAELVLRIDAGRSLTPDPAWFVQWGLSQYF